MKAGWAMKTKQNGGESGNGNGKVNDNGTCLEGYKRCRQNYLDICTKYGLNPFDLDILSISASRLPKVDKVKIVGLIIKIIKLERMLKSQIDQCLFPLTIEESERTGYLVPSRSDEDSCSN